MSKISPQVNEVENNDKDWIRAAVIAPRYVSAATRSSNRRYPDDGEIFLDTTPGGNLSVNPRPQMTPTADLRMKTLAHNSLGMGRKYADKYQNSRQRAIFQFGVPKYNSLSKFLGRFYNPHMATLVNRGETSFAYTLGAGLAFLVTFPLQAYFAVEKLVSKIGSFLSNVPSNKFYYMKPTMSLYWNTVTAMFNSILVNMGILQASYKEGDQIKALTKQEVQNIVRALPDIFTQGSDGELGAVDVYAMATRAQRLNNANQEALHAIASNGNLSEEDFIKRVRDVLSSRRTSAPDTKYPKYGEYFNEFMNHKSNRVSEVKTKEEKRNEDEYIFPDPTSFSDYLKGELSDGSAFVSFEVDTVQPNESWSNSVTDSSLAEKLKGANKQAKDVKASLAGGNVLGETAQSVTTALTDFVTGAADQVGLSGIFGIMGNAYVDIPKIWDDSSVQLTSTTFKTRLQTNYGNKLCVAIDLYLPLCMLIAAISPRSTGLNSYSSPFLCSVFMEGVTEAQLAIFESLNVTRFVGEVGMTVDSLPTAIDVEWSVLNLDSIMHMPIVQSLGDNFNHFDEPSAFTNYLAALSGLSLYDRFYVGPRIKLAWGKTLQNFESWTSASAMAQWSATTIPGKMLSGIARTGILR